MILCLLLREIVGFWVSGGLEPLEAVVEGDQQLKIPIIFYHKLINFFTLFWMSCFLVPVNFLVRNVKMTVIASCQVLPDLLFEEPLPHHGQGVLLVVGGHVLHHFIEHCCQVPVNINLA